jgi:hypothetical protein
VLRRAGLVSAGLGAGTDEVLVQTVDTTSALDVVTLAKAVLRGR